VSGGLGPLGVQKGFSELRQMGFTGRLPAVACIQVEGCAPMAQAWKRGLAQAEPLRTPRTHIATLATGDPGRVYTLLFERMHSGGGLFESVSDEETFRTVHLLAKIEGVSVEPAAAVAFAGLIRLARAGRIRPEDVVVVNCSGHTMSVERDILGEAQPGWLLRQPGSLLEQPEPSLEASRIENPAQSLAITPEEGLLAALSQLDLKRSPRGSPPCSLRIAIVDDNPDARRLVRRILQANGDYTLLEAGTGHQALALARREPIDLMILDLMMPEVDGFAVLEALKADPRTAAIPVIVVTAKELTRQEKERLNGRIRALMQKGDLLNDELLEEVTALVR
jgi:threonine synthase